MCFRCLCHLIISLRCYGNSLSASEHVLRCYMQFLQANMATLVYGILSQAIMFVGLYGIFANAHVHAVMRFYGRCYLCFLRGLGLRDLFLFFVFLVYGLIRLVWQHFQLRLRRWRSKSVQTVDRALVCVRQLAGRPVELSDGTAIVAALEKVADVSRSAGHVDFKRHEAILKQCRPLTHDPRLLAVVTQLLGDDESKKIAGKIQKILKSDHLFSAPQVHMVTLSGASKSPRLSSPTGEWAWPIHSVWLWQLQ